LLALSPLTWASFPVTQWLLWAASVAAATGSVVLVVRDMGAQVTRRLWLVVFAWACASVLALEPARSGIDYGQIELILMFVIVADLLLVPSPYRGVLIGIAAAVKLTPLVFVIVLIVSRDVRSVMRAAAAFLACTGLFWLYSPGLSRAYWLHDVIHPARIGTITYGGNQSWYAILHRPPFPATGSAPAWLLISLAVLAASILVARRCVRVNQKALAIIAVALAGLLISPISWTHHWIWVLLIPPVLVRGSSPGVPRPVRLLLWGIVALTIVAPYWWFSGGIPADVFDAVLPLWTSAALVVWGATAGQGASTAAARAGLRFRYHLCMTNAMTVRLDEETSRELGELAERHPSRSAAVQAAIHQAWQRLQEEKLQAGYAAAVADNPHYPYESAEEAAALRVRRGARQARDGTE
jgi:alpha-1,2-mannosyltransferase